MHNLTHLLLTANHKSTKAYANQPKHMQINLENLGNIGYA